MSRAYLVDTDWLIDHLRGAEAVTRRLAALRPAGLAVSVISVAELYEDVHGSRDPEGGRRALVRLLSATEVLPVDEAVCDVFGRERARLRQQGRLIGDFDLLIAATCLRHGLVLCSNNRRHFEMVDGLRVESV